MQSSISLQNPLFGMHNRSWILEFCNLPLIYMNYLINMRSNGLHRDQVIWMSDFLMRKELWMALFLIKNENSPCEAFLFCQNKVPNQFPIFVMKYAYGSGNLIFVLIDTQRPSGFPPSREWRWRGLNGYWGRDALAPKCVAMIFEFFHVKLDFRIVQVGYFEKCLGTS